MDVRDRQRAWLGQVLASRGLSGTALAKRAGLAQTTITNFLNEPDYPHALSARSIAAIEAIVGVPFSTFDSGSGFAEGDGARYLADDAEPGLSTAIRQLTGDRNGVDPWTLKSRALEGVGYIPGDILIVDLNATEKPGDIVCAQSYKRNTLGAKTIFRVWQPPFLIAKTFDPTVDPLIPVDNDNVVIRGVVLASLRGRQARDAA